MNINELANYAEIIGGVAIINFWWEESFRQLIYELIEQGVQAQEEVR